MVVLVINGFPDGPDEPGGSPGDAQPANTPTAAAAVANAIEAAVTPRRASPDRTGVTVTPSVTAPA
jgi:hypothetical protein